MKVRPRLAQVVAVSVLLVSTMAPAAPPVAKRAEAALPDLQELRGLIESGSVDASLSAAEILLSAAEKNRLAPEGVEMAARLMRHDDPFVRAVAEWALATKVGAENGGGRIAWPRPDPPEWFNTFSRQPPESFVEADYVRSAVGLKLLRDAAGLVESAEAVSNRARAVANEALPAAAPATRALIERQLAELDAICRKMGETLGATGVSPVLPEKHGQDARATPDFKADQALVTLRRLWLSARLAARPIVLSNPAVDFDQIVFIKRYPAHSHRNITGSQYPWSHKPGGDICIQEGLEPGGKLRGIARAALGPGHAHGMDLWWDADRLVFGYARQPDWPPPYDPVKGNHVFLLRGCQEPTHIFEIGIDGGGLRQLTDHPYWSDLEPTYLADGDVVFASGRSGRSSECGNFGADHTVVNLYAVSRASGEVRRLNDNKDIDRYPHSLDNGLIAYTRWEYQERHFFEVHAIWTIRPDGTMADAVFNQHMRAPYGFRDTRSVPGSSKLISVAAGHHTFAYGPIVLVDPSLGINNPAAISIVTPGSKPQEGPMAGEPVAEGGVPDRGGLYQTPWALSEKCFLVSYSHARVPSGSAGGDNTHGFALYLIDVHGNKELIHRDPILSCSFPIPLRKRPRPPLLPVMADRRNPYATCYVADVNRGLKGIERGTVKYIRIMQRIGWPMDDKIGAMRWIRGPAYARKLGPTAWSPVRVVGTVPVEPDGSAHFKVPVDAAVYFQALDARGMEIRRMRSHVTFQPGETRGCLGCHETGPTTPNVNWAGTTAVRHEPVMPKPPAWGAEKLLGYEWLVQPILDKHCVSCHGSKEPDAGLDFTATRGPEGFFQSFRTICGVMPGQAKAGGRWLVAVSNRFSDASITRPLEFGSHKSPLVRVLLDDELHKKEVKLDPDEWTALVTWVDANAPYHDTFFNRRPAGGGPVRRDIRMEFPLSFTTPEKPAEDAGAATH